MFHTGQFITPQPTLEKWEDSDFDLDNDCDQVVRAPPPPTLTPDAFDTKAFPGLRSNINYVDDLSGLSDFEVDDTDTENSWSPNTRTVTKPQPIRPSIVGTGAHSTPPQRMTLFTPDTLVGASGHTASDGSSSDIKTPAQSTLERFRMSTSGNANLKQLAAIKGLNDNDDDDDDNDDDWAGVDFPSSPTQLKLKQTDYSRLHRPPSPESSPLASPLPPSVSDPSATPEGIESELDWSDFEATPRHKQQRGHQFLVWGDAHDTTRETPLTPSPRHDPAFQLLGLGTPLKQRLEFQFPDLYQKPAGMAGQTSTSSNIKPLAQAKRQTVEPAPLANISNLNTATPAPLAKPSAFPQLTSSSTNPSPTSPPKPPNLRLPSRRGLFLDQPMARKPTPSNHLTNPSSTKHCSPTVTGKRRPLLIRNLNSHKIAKTIGNMVYHPEHQVWVGNENALHIFRPDAPLAKEPPARTSFSSTRSSHSYASSTQSRNNPPLSRSRALSRLSLSQTLSERFPGLGIKEPDDRDPQHRRMQRIVSYDRSFSPHLSDQPTPEGMVFDPIHMRWISTNPHGEEEEDVFAGINDLEVADGFDLGTIRSNPSSNPATAATQRRSASLGRSPATVPFPQFSETSPYHSLQSTDQESASDSPSSATPKPISSLARITDRFSNFLRTHKSSPNIKNRIQFRKGVASHGVETLSGPKGKAEPNQITTPLPSPHPLRGPSANPRQPTGSLYTSDPHTTNPTVNPGPSVPSEFVLHPDQLRQFQQTELAHQHMLTYWLPDRRARSGSILQRDYLPGAPTRIIPTNFTDLWTMVRNEPA
ncbi:hypothetical protein BJ085DRAFT_39605 [Dimargaris cristalligena]|uniref:Uncharacterized protein n=1 Tax=Dimargaris cristalligena TaxID=215637 RepID=A0A4P9ZMW3_9FUNG|nr:hypothetical protein BJ085DRAFT_39605 [Dimargaris cristalligena]|eukprot:RKP33931.1 hypothetical protein BJ085DRAFT_39605 [Dimargaris cristalligena]